MKKIFSKAFTLAEVLITLGIIGVVAALTIPTLIQNSQESQMKTAAKEAFSKSAQAVQQMGQDEDISYYQSTTQSFKPVFMTYFKVLKDCNWQDCINASSGYKTINGNPAAIGLLDDGQFITTDGMVFAINNLAGGPISISVDVNGYTKPPNAYGLDLFTFQIVNGNLLPMGAQNTSHDPSFYCNRANSSNVQGIACTYKVMLGLSY